MGVPEGEEEEQEIGNLFEKIMKKNFPNLTKERDFCASPGSTKNSQSSGTQRGLQQDTS